MIRGFGFQRGGFGGSTGNAVLWFSGLSAGEVGDHVARRATQAPGCAGTDRGSLVHCTYRGPPNRHPAFGCDPGGVYRRIFDHVALPGPSDRGAGDGGSSYGTGERGIADAFGELSVRIKSDKVETRWRSGRSA